MYLLLSLAIWTKHSVSFLDGKVLSQITLTVILHWLPLQTLQQNSELRRRLQKIHAESATFGAEPKLVTAADKDISLHASMQANANKASLWSDKLCYDVGLVLFLLETVLPVAVVVVAMVSDHVMPLWIRLCCDFLKPSNTTTVLVSPAWHWCFPVSKHGVSLFGYIARMPDETDAQKILTAAPLKNWRSPPGRPRTTWMKTIQQDLKSENLSPNETINVAQNRPLWRLMSMSNQIKSNHV